MAKLRAWVSIRAVWFRPVEGAQSPGGITVGGRGLAPSFGSRDMAVAPRADLDSGLAEVAAGGWPL